MIDNWLTLDLFFKRESLLKEVLKSFKNDIYGAVIALLMSQVEGVITEELVLHNKGLKKNGEANNWSIRIKEFDEIVRAEKIGHCPNLEYLIKNQKIAPNSIDDQLNLPALQESQSLSTYP
ncbi:MAG: hypothetical protein O8C61_07610 [Candidatus Methanoperedens sp.]|nr:hypothetical protein [Candidatus Methanoperedens sp.]